MNWRKHIPRLVIALNCLAICASNAFSQNSAPSATDDPIRLCEKAADEVRILRIQNASLVDQIKLYEALVANLKEQSAFWKEAATLRKDALAVDLRIEQNWREQVAGLKDEVTRLRDENAKLRRSRDQRTFLSFGAGLALGQSVKFR